MVFLNKKKAAVNLNLKINNNNNDNNNQGRKKSVENFEIYYLFLFEKTK
jgi:hypothetical protein